MYWRLYASLIKEEGDFMEQWILGTLIKLEKLGLYINFKFNKYFHDVKCQNTWLDQICQDGPHFLASKVEATFTSIFMGNIRVGRPLFKFIHLLKASQLTLRSIETLSFKRCVSLFY